ncbi:MAG: hypothetical protein ACFCVD_15110 [Nodosilinea sp.]
MSWVLGVGIAWAVLSLFVVPPVAAQRPFADCLSAADSLFRDGSPSELAAIRACRGTTDPDDVSACIDLADALWRDGSDAELAGLAACQVQRRLEMEAEEAETGLVGLYATCFRQAQATTHAQTLPELAAIQACSGLTQLEEVAPCLSLVESLWHDDTAAELAGLAACSFRLGG